MNSGLLTLFLPNNLESIEDGVFKGCSQMELRGYSITIPPKLRSIGSEAFYCCQKLRGFMILKKDQQLEVSTNVFQYSEIRFIRKKNYNY